MAQHDYVIDNQSFPATRTDINNVLLAISSTNSGTSAPSTTYANQLWYDTTHNKLYIRNEDNDAWIPLFLLDQSNDVAGTLATEIDVEDASGTDTAGTALTIKGGAGTGTGAGGSIIFQTADGAASTASSVNAHATQVTITDDGTVGIGTASPTGATTTTLHINGTTNAGIHITDSASGATDSDGVYFSMDSPNLYIQNKEAGFTAFETSGSERMRILSGDGLTFNGDTAAANALDDYEEGTWTPVHGGNNMTQVTPCRYTKIGRAVFLTMDATSAVGSSSTHVISGLPFTPGGTFGALHIAFATGNGIQGGYIGHATDQIILIVAGTNTNDTLTAGTRIIGTGMYFV